MSNLESQSTKTLALLKQRHLEHSEGTSLQDDLHSLSKVNSLIDLTLLNEQTTKDAIDNLIEKAIHQNVAAICVFPSHLCHIPDKITRATVVNFPTGNQPHNEVMYDIENIMRQNQVDEIDYVFPYQLYLANNKTKALAACREAYQLCKANHLTFKIILETGALPSLDVIYKLSLELIEKGCDFLKTSTGKIDTGATLPAAFAILAAIREIQAPCGIKVSGGIRTIGQAQQYIQLAEHVLELNVDKHSFRIGTSGLA
ncbi:MAG: deoxyribose-phosphate aldolase [Legionellaceae bacterium]|nr:deoxyribose-phosphate aldolase [Legionellaceae bacterium]